MPPVSRHLSDKKSEYNNTISFFIAPQIHQDTLKWCEFIKFKDDLDFLTFSFNEFLEKLETCKSQMYIDCN